MQFYSLRSYFCNHGNNSWANSNETPEHSHSYWVMMIFYMPQAMDQDKPGWQHVQSKHEYSWCAPGVWHAFTPWGGHRAGACMTSCLWELWTLRLKQTSLGRDILHVSLRSAAREKSTSVWVLQRKDYLRASTWPLYWWIPSSCCLWTTSFAIINLNCEYNFILSFRSFPSEPLDWWVVMRPSKQDHWVDRKLRLWRGGRRNEFNFLVQCFDHLHYLH